MILWIASEKKKGMRNRQPMETANKQSRKGEVLKGWVENYGKVSVQWRSMKRERERRLRKKYRG